MFVTIETQKLRFAQLENVVKNVLSKVKMEHSSCGRFIKSNSLKVV